MGVVDPDERKGVNQRSSWEFLRRTATLMTRKAPALADVSVIRQWAGMYDVSPDHQPLVGPTSQLDGWWQANGWSGRGMLLGPYLTELLAERFVTGVTPDRLAAFDPDRFAPDEAPEKKAAGDYYARYAPGQRSGTSTRRSARAATTARSGCFHGCLPGLMDRQRSAGSHRSIRRDDDLGSPDLAAGGILDPPLFPAQWLGHHALAPVHRRRRLAAALAGPVARDRMRLRDRTAVADRRPVDRSRRARSAVPARASDGPAPERRQKSSVLPARRPRGGRSRAAPRGPTPVGSPSRGRGSSPGPYDRPARPPPRRRPASSTGSGAPARALDRADAERHPLRRVLEAVRLGVAARVDLLEALRLDPHPLALEQAEDAGLAGLGALVLAVRAGALVVLAGRSRGSS